MAWSVSAQGTVDDVSQHIQHQFRELGELPNWEENNIKRHAIALIEVALFSFADRSVRVRAEANGGVAADEAAFFPVSVKIEPTKKELVLASKSLVA